MRRRSHELIDAMLAGGPPAEFIDALAFPLPGETVFRCIGFPDGDDEMLKPWCSRSQGVLVGQAIAEEQTEIAEKLLAYWRYCRDFTATKRDAAGRRLLRPSCSTPTMPTHPDAPASYREVESIVYGLSFAGHEAVTA